MSLMQLFLLASLGVRWHWHIPLHITLRGGGLQEFENLKMYLEALPAGYITAGPAYVTWPLKKSSVFSVSLMRRELVKEKFAGVSVFPVDTIWEALAPPKVQGFLWLIFHKRIATIENLQ
ncbi:hypothetical protein LINGRAHAP2_LOCUS31155 [Linum grandiflorum]